AVFVGGNSFDSPAAPVARLEAVAGDNFFRASFEVDFLHGTVPVAVAYRIDEEYSRLEASVEYHRRDHSPEHFRRRTGGDWHFDPRGARGRLAGYVSFTQLRLVDLRQSAV